MSLDSLYHATNKRLSEAQEMLAALASSKISFDGETVSHKQREISARIDHILRWVITIIILITYKKKSNLTNNLW